MREELSGNTAGLKASHSKRLLATWRRRVQQRELVSAELARHLCELSREIGRQLGVLLNRRGEVEHVIVGDARQLVLPDIGRARAGHARLRGLRLVHTHLKDEPLTRDDLTDLVLLRLDAVAAVVARDDGLPGKVYLATLLPWNIRGDLYLVQEAASLYELQFDAQAQIVALEAEMARVAPVRAVGVEGRAILVGVHTREKAAAEASLQELQELARTAGVQVLDAILQTRREIDPRTLVGEGKLQEILVRSMALGADLLVFDRDLTPSQARHIGEATSLRILDRTQRRAPTESCKSSWPSSSTSGRGWWGATTRSRGWRAESAAAGPARPSWKWTAAACATASPRSRRASTASRWTAASAAASATAAACR